MIIQVMRLSLNISLWTAYGQVYQQTVDIMLDADCAYLLFVLNLYRTDFIKYLLQQREYIGIVLLFYMDDVFSSIILGFVTIFIWKSSRNSDTADDLKKQNLFICPETFSWTLIQVRFALALFCTFLWYFWIIWFCTMSFLPLLSFWCSWHYLSFFVYLVLFCNFW